MGTFIRTNAWLLAPGATLVLAALGCGANGGSGHEDAHVPPDVADVDRGDAADTGGDLPLQDVQDDPDMPADDGSGTDVLAGPPVVALDQGVLRGRWQRDGKVRSFLGVPYVQPPLGNLRFRPPQPLPASDAVFEANDWGTSCPQEEGLLIESPTGEDCLTANVWAPADDANAPAAGWPVYVFIHGGGCEVGSSASTVLDGTNLAAQGLVVVTGNYRLGPLGFLAHPALTAETAATGGDATVGNQGILDQRALLRWARDHAAAFGGDPANVTLAGQSAGGMSVCIHLADTYRADRPAGEEPFRRVVMESGACFENLPSKEAAEAQGVALAAAVGCPEDADVLACLRTKDPDVLRTALPLKQGYFFGEGAWWMPTVDGVAIRQQPMAGVAAIGAGVHGVGGPLQVLLGSNKDEGGLLRFLAFPDLSQPDPEAFDAFVQQVFGADAEAVKTQFPQDAYASPQKRLDDILGTFTFVCPTRRLARTLAALEVPTYLYRFLHAPGFLPLPDFGAYHTAELPFVFDTPPMMQAFSPRQEVLAKAMSGAWAAFATSGNPGTVGGATWPTLDAAAGADDEHLSLDIAPADGDAIPPADGGIRAGTGYVAAACDFWDAFDAKP